MDTELMTKTAITPADWEQGMTYQEYRTLIDTLLAQHRTTNDNNTETMVGYTVLNNSRMDKWEKRAAIHPDVLSVVTRIDQPQKWLIITEGWCGDSAQNVPIIQKIADLNKHIEVRYLLRDENTHIIDEYLFNGGRSIPILIILNDAFQDLAKWGPRPKPMLELLSQLKQGEFDKEAFNLQLHTWYAKDRTVTVQKELAHLLAGTIS